MAEAVVEQQNGSSMAIAGEISAVMVQVNVPASKAEEAVEFYKAAFGATEVTRRTCSKRKADQEQPALLCAELKIGSSSILVCGQVDESTAVAKEGRIVLRVQVDDVEAAVSKATEAGSTLQGEMTEDETCGGGSLANLADPFGVAWAITCSPKQETEA